MNDSQRLAIPEPVGDVVKASAGGLAFTRTEDLGRPAAMTYLLPSDRLLDGIPPEYHAATLSAGMKATLNEWPLALALMGDPGTGKTWTCWAALIAARRKWAERLLLTGIVVEPAFLPSGSQRDGYNQPCGPGEWTFPDRAAWIDTCATNMVEADRVRIISECQDIRRHRFDRAWLDQVANWHAPHAKHRSYLCVDDIGFTGLADDWVKEALYEIGNIRRANMLPTIWTSNLDRPGLARVFGDAIASRICGGITRTAKGQDRRLQD